MSQKNETAVLILSLLITAALLGAGFWWFTKGKGGITSNPQSPTTEASTSGSGISAGEKSLIPGEGTPDKVAGISAIASKDYTKAVQDLQNSLKANRNDPEALIYLNNARIGTAKSYAIAVSVPISNSANIASEMLRGVAQAQNEINQKGGINGVPLKVIIADDNNNSDTAQQVARELINNPAVLGVVGNFSSGVTLAAGKVYQDGQLVLISPTSTSVQLSGFGNYIFRTVPSDRFSANALSRYMLNGFKKQKAAVFFNSTSNYSQSLKNEFSTALAGDGGEVVNEFDFNSPSFSASDAVQQATQKGAEVLVLLGDSGVSDKALQVVQVNDKKLLLLAGDDVYDSKTLQVGRQLAVGMVLAVPWHILADPQSPFPKAANQLWGGEVNWRTALSYDAAEALIAAIGRNPTRSGVQGALSSNFSAPGASGEIRFLPSGDRNRPVQLVKIQPGNRTPYGYEFVPVPKI